MEGGMATEAQVLAKADEVLDGLQGLITNDRFNSYRGSLVPRHAALFSAREGFSNSNPSPSIMTKLKTALTRVNNARPTDSSIIGVSSAVDKATAALNAG
jgi:hypothetical protein